MNILIIGNGGREFTFAWKISESPLCDQLYIAPGNAGTEQFGINVSIAVDDLPSIADLIREEEIDMLIVGPEAPLVLGIRDYLQADPSFRELLIIGPGKQGAALEGSKDFSKAFMNRYGIPTAKAVTFRAEQWDEALVYLDQCDYPVVIKADGLAGGKGVTINKSREEAELSLKDALINRQFGEAGNKVLIEEFLEGIELSVFVLTDGKDYVILPEAKDYKRIGEHDTGLNTGGMGAVSPVTFADEAFMEKVRHKIVEPTIHGLKEDGIPYTGFIFIGLIKTGDDPYVIEYNVRMGDPETQVVLPRIQNDLVELFQSCANGTLSGQVLKTDPAAAATVVLVSGGYPGRYEKGKRIEGLADITEALVVHAGTRREEYNILTDGGRVLAVTGMGETLEEALEESYEAIQYIHWEDMYYRKDIGKDVLASHLD